MADGQIVLHVNIIGRQPRLPGENLGAGAVSAGGLSGFFLLFQNPGQFALRPGNVFRAAGFIRLKPRQRQIDLKVRLVGVCRLVKFLLFEQSTGDVLMRVGQVVQEIDLIGPACQQGLQYRAAFLIGGDRLGGLCQPVMHVADLAQRPGFILSWSGFVHVAF